jgi:type IV secretory pathway TraG/TraD family ATPase VirD4
VAVVLAFQDLQQLSKETDRSVVASNSGVMICMPRVSPATAELMSKRLGEHPVQTASMSKGPIGGARHGQTTSFSTQMAPVLGAREIMAPPFGDYVATVHAPEMNDRPFLVDATREI